MYQCFAVVVLIWVDIFSWSFTSGCFCVLSAIESLGHLVDRRYMFAVNASCTFFFIFLSFSELDLQAEPCVYQNWKQTFLLSFSWSLLNRWIPVAGFWNLPWIFVCLILWTTHFLYFVGGGGLESGNCWQQGKGLETRSKWCSDVVFDAAQIVYANRA